NERASGYVDLMLLELGSAFQLYKGGRAKVLAISAPRRAAQMPDIPSFAEAGVPEFKSDTWNAIVAPPKTSPAIVARLNGAINDALGLPEVQAQFANISMQPVGGTPSSLASLIKQETKRWGDVIRAARITAD